MGLVSILVPIYNVEKYIRRCLNSLFEQDFLDIEYVFVNDASPDNSMKILQEVMLDYPQRCCQVKIINHQFNRGLAASRRTAIENATSPYILHVDSDDYIEKKLVSSLYHRACEEKADLVLSSTLIEYSTKKIPLENGWNSNKWEYLSLMLVRKVPTNIWGKLIKRNLVIEHSIFAEEGVNQGEDYQVVPQIVYYAKSITDVDAVYYYNKTNNLSYTNNISLKGIKNIIHSQEILVDFFSTKNEISKSLLDESCIYNKLTLLSISSLSEYPLILFSYKNVKWKGMNLKLGHRVLLLLLDLKLNRLAYCLVFMFQLVFRNR